MRVTAILILMSIPFGTDCLAAGKTLPPIQVDEVESGPMVDINYSSITDRTFDLFYQNKRVGEMTCFRRSDGLDISTYKTQVAFDHLPFERVRSKQTCSNLVRAIRQSSTAQHPVTLVVEKIWREGRQLDELEPVNVGPTE